MELGPARLSEAGALAEMSRALIEQGLDWRWRAGPIARLIRDRDTEVVVARSAAGIGGFAAMHLRGELGHLLLLAVRPELRRLGVGRQLMEYLLAIAREAMLEELRLEVRAVNESAREFYRTLGFKEVARVRGYYDGRETAVVMIAALTDR